MAGRPFQASNTALGMPTDQGLTARDQGQRVHIALHRNVCEGTAEAAQRRIGAPCRCPPPERRLHGDILRQQRPGEPWETDYGETGVGLHAAAATIWRVGFDDEAAELGGGKHTGPGIEQHDHVGARGPIWAQEVGGGLLDQQRR